MVERSAKSSSTGFDSGELHGAERWSRRILDAGILLLLFVAPLFLGGRHPFGKLIYVGIVWGTACLWCGSVLLQRGKRWYGTGVEWVLMLAVGLLVAQVTMLPSEWLAWCSPELSRLLPLWGTEAGNALGLTRWNTLSVNPVATRHSLSVLLAHATLFLLVFQRLRTMEDLERLIRWIAYAVSAMALLGIAQYLLGNGKFLWFYRYYYTDTDGVAKGCFSTTNHFAHFMALGVAPLIWCIWKSSGGTQQKSSRKSSRQGGFSTRREEQGGMEKLMLMLALGLVALAGMLSFSRGGGVMLLFATSVGMGLFAALRLMERKLFLLVGGSAAMAMTALSIYGYEPLMKEMETLQVSSLEEAQETTGRMELWSAGLKTYRHFPLVGTGAGTHEWVYLIFLGSDPRKTYTYAESGYLQVLLETGTTGACLLGLGILLLSYWCWRTFRDSHSSAVQAANCTLITALSVSLIQSIWDFVWYIPACLTVTLMLSACACRLYQLRRGESARPEEEGIALPRLAWLGGLAGLLAMACSGWQALSPPAMAFAHWQEYLFLTRDAQPGKELAVEEQTRQIEQMQGHLENALRNNPTDDLVQVRLAAVHLQKFEFLQEQSDNPMTLGEIRDAVEASQFPNIQACHHWLTAALGENSLNLYYAFTYARRSVQKCPLQGTGYAILSEVAFLQGADRQKLVDQALAVRPSDGFVNMTAGNLAATRQNLEAAFHHWKIASQMQGKYFFLLVRMLGNSLPAEVLLNRLEPNLPGLRYLFTHYRKQKALAQAAVVGPLLAERLQEQTKTAPARQIGELWWDAYSVYSYLKQPEEALRCARKCIEIQPHDFAKRRTLITALLEAGQPLEALEHTKWCLRRRPDDPELRKLTEQITRQAGSSRSVQ